jgi:hypothetical protein
MTIPVACRPALIEVNAADIRRTGWRAMADDRIRYGKIVVKWRQKQD